MVRFTPQLRFRIIPNIDSPPALVKVLIMMNSVEDSTLDRRLNERLATSGFRFTPQRQQVYNVLLEKRDHPTAEEVFIRTKKVMPDISMATVYNCLDALVKCGVVRQVNLNRGPTRFCPNMKEHCHFYCEECGQVFDIDWNQSGRNSEIRMPKGFKVNHYEVAIHGVCPSCSKRIKS
jgi:Fur family peroxide stress response transcriptional regulator